ncbi:MAG: 16S rRNA (cytosine(1402)-N(4))-methyltransferase RsmH, partial [Chloroflexota bacterium]|nr:16S rRNA (cytosine(1402)-N(4))-methyltransferase RsmH [Chloroflexota bacterium]
MQTQHVPVMLEEVLKFLRPEPGRHYIDGTLGGGGHTEALLERSAPEGKVLGIDADIQALARVRERLAELVSSGQLVLVQGNFAELTRIVDEVGFVSIQGILLDLGFSSHQMDNPERGFAFSADGPLDMRLDQSEGMSAADLVNSASEQELADIIWRYGEEKRSRQIARHIIHERAKGAITRTTQLAKLAAAGVPFKSGTIHPATKTFQALRIAVNHELERLESVLPQMLEVLSARGEM